MTRCGNGHENQDDQQFCGECGQSLNPEVATVGSHVAEHSSRWKWLRSRAALVVGVWIVVFGAVLFLSAVPYRVHKTVRITTEHRQYFDLYTNKCGADSSSVDLTTTVCASTYTTAATKYPMSCRAAMTDAFRRPSALPTGDGTHTASEADITRLKYACHDAATTRLWIAGGVFIAAVIGTWLFFNLAPAPRKRKRENIHNMAPAS